MRLITGLAVIAGFFLAISGFLLLSEAMLGAGLIALACFAGIVARIAQASEQHSHLAAMLQAGQQAAAAPASSAPTSTAAAEEWIGAGARR